MRRRGGGGGGGVSSLSQCGFGLKKEFCDKVCSFGIVVVAAAVERDFFLVPFCKVLSLSFFFVCFPSIISCRMLLLFSFPVCNVSLVLAAGS